MITMTATGLTCLALTIFHEARSASPKAQRAVAMVVMNRAEGDPDQVCRVVFEPFQFSWVNGRARLTKGGRRIAMQRSLDPRREVEEWALAEHIALRALTGVSADPTYGSTHYHEVSILPAWAKSARLRRIGRFGPHVFYKPSKQSVISDYNGRITIAKGKT